MIKKILKATLPQNVRTQIKKTIWSTLQKSLESSGYTVSRRNDYYSPLPSVLDLKPKYKRWSRPSNLGGVSYDINRIKQQFLELLSGYLEEFSALPPFDELKKIGYGPGFTEIDALTLYVMVRHHKPKRYIEVGSGLSTYYCSLAAEKNAAEGAPVALTCIEPYPYKKLQSIEGIKVVVKEVQDVGIEFFEQLEKNDFLFID